MKDGCKVKICGTTNLEDALMAAHAGADYFGVVIEVGFSPRSLTVEDAEILFSKPPIPAVALVFNMEEQRIGYLIERLNPYAVQFLGQNDSKIIKRLKHNYPGVQLWQSVHLPCAGSGVDVDELKNTVRNYIEAGIDLILYDTAAVINGVQKFGGTGMVSDWNVIRRLMEEIKVDIPVLLAGGIRPENVAEAISSIKPDGVDLCSGVELLPGKKDIKKVQALMEEVKRVSNKEGTK